MKKIILFVILTILYGVCWSSEYSNTPTTGNKGYWNWLENTAYQRFKNGTFLTVTFLPNYHCNYANFGIVSNDKIKSIRLDIDGNRYSNLTPNNLTQQNNQISAEFILSNSALRELKKGAYLKIDIGNGEIASNLSGSAKSFNMAYGNCMKVIENKTQRSREREIPKDNSNYYKKKKSQS